MIAVSVITLIAQLSLTQTPATAPPNPEAKKAPPAAATQAPAAPAAAASPGAPAAAKDAKPVPVVPESSPEATFEPPESVPAQTTTAPAPAPTATPVTSAPKAAPASDAKPAAATATDAPRKKERLLVLDFNDKGAGPEITQAVGQAVAKQAAESFIGEVVTPAQIEAELDRGAMQEALGCDSNNCMVFLGDKVDARVVLAGNVAAVGGDFLITVIAVDVVEGKRIGFEQRKVPNENALYFYAAKQMTSVALTGKSVDYLVPVQFSFEGASDPRVIIDGKESQLDKNNLVQLDPGQHEVKVDAAGYDTWKSTLTIEEGTPLQIQVQLVSSRVALWPVSLTVGAISVISFMGFLVMGTIAQLRYGQTYATPFGDVILNDAPGVGSLFPYDQSYHGLKPASSAQLGEIQSQATLFAAIGDVALVVAVIAGGAAAVVLAADVAWWALSE